MSFLTSIGLKSIVRFGLRHGGLELVRSRHRHELRILMYHRFQGMEKAFADQCDHLLTRYHPMSLSAVCQHWRDDVPLPPNAVVISVDDGYRDVYTSALPVLRARGMPAVVYLVTDFLDGSLWLWTDQVQYVVERTQRTRIEIPGEGGTGIKLELGSATERRSAVGALKKYMKGVSNQSRLSILAELPERTGVPLPAAPPPGCEPLSWDEARTMAAAGIEFGGHTRTHPILSRLETREKLLDEIASCRARIEQQLQQPAVHFCYPNGRPADLSPEIFEITRQAGYDSAVTTLSGLNTARSDRFALRRIGVNPDVPPYWFEQVAAGFRVTERDA